MATPARAHLESLLRARNLDATLPDAHPLVSDEASLAPSGIEALDARLGGGWPRGHVSEIVGPRSSGRTWVMAQALAAATRRGELAALVDTFDAFDPEGAVPLAPTWPYFLWIRGHGPSPTRYARSAVGGRGDELLERAVDRAIKAAALVLQAGGFGIVALDLADVPTAALRRLPFTTWLRLQRLLEGHQTVALIVAEESMGRSARGITVRFDVEGGVSATWQGEHDRTRRFGAVPARARISRARWQPSDADVCAMSS
jgi:hypothetical protein